MPRLQKLDLSLKLQVSYCPPPLGRSRNCEKQITYWFWLVLLRAGHEPVLNHIRENITHLQRLLYHLDLCFVFALSFILKEIDTFLYSFAFCIQDCQIFHSNVNITKICHFKFSLLKIVLFIKILVFPPFSYIKEKKNTFAVSNYGNLHLLSNVMIKCIQENLLFLMMPRSENLVFLGRNK